MSDHRPTTRLGLVGAVCWGVQPLFVLTELVAAAQVRAPYSFLHNTISDLGALTCTTVRYPNVDVPVCSPGHAWVNGGFLLGAVLLAVGAIALRAGLPRSRLITAATVLWIISAASSVATALVPLDVDVDLHALVSTPAFVCQPAALILTGVGLRRLTGHRRWLAMVAGGAALFALSAFFVVRLDTRWGGLLERLSLWPVALALPVLAVAVLRAGRYRRSTPRAPAPVR